MERIIKLSVLLLALMMSTAAIAEEVYDFDVDGIYYKILENGNEVSVTYKTYYYSSHTANYESDYTGDVVIPATVTFNGKTFQVTEIGDHAFYQRRSVTSITIPSSVTAIRWDAFSFCTGLTRVNITDIAAWCNINCGYGDNPLQYAHHLFLNGEEITELVIPEGVTSIKNGAFSQCIALTSVSIGNSVISIGNNAFDYCTSLTSVSIGNSVTEIGQDAFDGCSSLASVTLGNSVETISNYAFAGCTSLPSINIPNSVTHIGIAAFMGCTSLTNAMIGNSVKTIGGYAFGGCIGLTSIEIPNTVTEIGLMAFNNCSSLTSVSIGNSITTIGKDAFMNAPAIATVTCKATTPPAWDDLSMFMTNVYNHAPLHVPSNTERAYMADSGWGQFLTIIGDADEGNTGGDDDYLKCDTNGDGEVNIADVNKVIDAILSH